MSSQACLAHGLSSRRWSNDKRTGIGRHIDLAMFDAMIAIQPLVVARYLASGQAPKRVGNRHALSAPFGAFQARDGMFVLAVLNNKLFGILAQLIGRPELSEDSRFGSDSDRLANEQALRKRYRRLVAPTHHRQAVEALVAAGVPAAEINDMAEALTSPHAQARGMLQETAASDAWRHASARAAGSLFAAHRAAALQRLPPSMPTARAILAELGMETGA